ncbi:MAG: hypothetical protein HQK71_03620 [Desulfamplus sp.]|nr:hypothetical protein [Desulfamplus sp.]
MSIERFLQILIYSALTILSPHLAYATQMHSAAEGVIVHQIGHLFFLISMIILYFTIRGKSLDSQQGWRLIQLSALLFSLWNLDALIVHFLDNQIDMIYLTNISIFEAQIDSVNNSKPLILFYYFLRLDHLLSLPAMILLWRGLSLILKQNLANQELIK